MPRKATIARLTGSVLLIAGFILAISGLDKSSPLMINIGIGLLGAGMASMVYTFFHTIKSRGPDRGPSAWKQPPD
jgi:hypothetical protein